MKHIIDVIKENHQFLVKGHLRKQTSVKKSGAVKDISNVAKGDILVTDYSYSSRRVYFWIVDSIVGKTIVNVREIDAKIIQGSYNGSGKVVPNMDLISTTITKGKIGKYGLKINKNIAWFWSGEPEDVYSD